MLIHSCKITFSIYKNLYKNLGNVKKDNEVSLLNYFLVKMMKKIRRLIDNYDKLI